MYEFQVHGTRLERVGMEVLCPKHVNNDTMASGSIANLEDSLL